MCIVPNITETLETENVKLTTSAKNKTISFVRPKQKQKITINLFDLLILCIYVRDCGQQCSLFDYSME